MCSQASHILELTNGSLATTLSALLTVLLEPTVEVEIKVAVTETLLQLTLPDAYFSEDDVSHVLVI